MLATSSHIFGRLAVPLAARGLFLPLDMVPNLDRFSLACTTDCEKEQVVVWTFFLKSTRKLGFSIEEAEEREVKNKVPP